MIHEQDWESLPLLVQNTFHRDENFLKLSIFKHWFEFILFYIVYAYKINFYYPSIPVHCISVRKYRSKKNKLTSNIVNILKHTNGHWEFNSSSRAFAFVIEAEIQGCSVELFFLYIRYYFFKSVFSTEGKISSILSSCTQIFFCACVCVCFLQGIGIYEFSKS